MIRALAIACASALVLAGCVGTPEGFDPLPVASQPRFDALLFFAGETEGRGTLSKLFSDPATVRVQGSGTVRDGVLTLDQRISEGDRPVRTRQWLIREDRPGHYTGTLTDAVGAVSGTAEGNLVTLRFTLAGGFGVVQRLTLSADGRRAHNVMTVRKLGVTVAVLSEDIRRVE